MTKSTGTFVLAVALVLAIGFVVVTHSGLGSMAGVGLYVLVRALLRERSAPPVEAPETSRDNARPPGTWLPRSTHVELFALLDAVARRLEVAPPDDVYLTHLPGARIRLRGTVQEQNQSAALELGLPLLHALDVAEVRAVVAHLLDHGMSGSTRHCDVVDRARPGAAGERPAPPADSTALADTAAADVAGGAALARALRKLDGLEAAYACYRGSEYDVVVESGHLPPAYEGFTLFLDAIARDPAQWTAPGHALAPGRIEAAEELAARGGPAPATTGSAESSEGAGPGPRAVSLLRDLPRLERDVLRRELGDARLKALTPIPWEQAAEATWLPRFRRAAERLGRSLGGEPVPALPARWPGHRDDLLARAVRLAGPGAVPAAQVRARLVRDLGAALSVALAERGHALVVMPGAAVVARGAAGAVEPFALARSLDAGAWTADDWAARCAELGLAGATLAPPAPPAPAAPAGPAADGMAQT